jgi:hypothetical protein
MNAYSGEVMTYVVESFPARVVQVCHHWPAAKSPYCLSERGVTPGVAVTPPTTSCFMPAAVGDDLSFLLPQRDLPTERMF